MSFDLATEPMAEPPRADVRDIERIHFFYKAESKFGETAPTNITLGRADFPRNVGHLCAVEPGGPASPCLAIGGLQPLYERQGIEAIMGRLRDFMRDAKTGTLMADGWEPVPFGVDEVLRIGQINPAFFQEHALANLIVGRAVGIAENHEEEGAERVLIFPGMCDPSQVSQAIAKCNAANEKREVGIPCVFVWPTQAVGEGEPIFEKWSTLGELRTAMDRLGLTAAFDAATGELLANGVRFKCRRHPLGGKAMVLIFGVWRPAPIMKAFFGYSSNPDARRLEFRAFLIMQDWDKEIVSDDARVETIIGHYPPHAKFLQWVSGVPPLPRIALFGLGALGSALFNNLVRSGLEDATIYDKDSIYPHNLARHTALVSDAFKEKPLHAEALANNVLRDASVRIEAAKADIVAHDFEQLKQRLEGRLVVDTTADERVRLKLDQLRLNSANTLIRTEMFHEGRLGITFVSQPDGPTMSDMMLQLIAMAPTEPSIAAWLDHEAQHPLGPDPLLYGFGCTSQTVRLPNHVVQLQAAVATNTVLENTSESGISMNALDERYRPKQWKWLPTKPFVVLSPSVETDWSIRVAPEVIEQLEAERQAALPNETGGYLYGSWEPTRKAITILKMTPLPPNSQAGPAELKLGPAGKTGVEQRLVRKTHGRIFLCGTWHSHPDGPARMSGRDHTTLMEHHTRDREALRPTLILIAAEYDIQAHLKVPQ